ncbi:MAG: ATP-binding protein [Bacteroidales bacterium]|nr:ATP-binding protein [Bacteroidales bacterium]MBN2698506.1 ATP-binding protein [Bacteroidales bacterium]
MPFKIAIASGKGGTGKTTFAVNLFRYLSQSMPGKVQLVDCDVEEPNDHIFFPEAQFEKLEKVYRLVPEIDQSKCTYCRKCVEYCEFNAIVVIPTVRFAEVNSSLCHSCGACIVACEDDAINEKPEEIGTIRRGFLPSGGRISGGTLKIGSSMQTMMIRELKKAVSGEAPITIFDAPPGTSCPVVAAIADADLIILVSEPTPFGMYDLKLSIDLLRELRKPFGVLINKSGLGTDELHNYLLNQGIELIGSIPFSRAYAGMYASGNLFNDIPEEVAFAFSEILHKLHDRILQHEGDHHSER